MDCGLLQERADILYPTSELADLAALDQDEAVATLFARAAVVGAEREPDLVVRQRDEALALLADDLLSRPEQREALLLALGRQFDEMERRELGVRGEEFVVQQARAELEALGRHDLAAAVRRVSAVSDQLGYDVVAPTLIATRRLEVKTMGRREPGLMRFFLSRNEFEVGLRDPAWALVACEVSGEKELSLLGWCRAAAVEPYVPIDSVGGRWAAAEIEVSVALLLPGLPPVA